MPKATIIFDYDGTLHDSMRLYGPALRSVYADLVERGYADPAELTDDEISQWLGWTVEDMWTTFLPGLPEEVWRAAAQRVGEEMDRLMKQGEGGLFPGVEKMLSQLRDEGFELVFLSNCGVRYRDEHLAQFGIASLFDHAFAAEEFDFIPKWKIFAKVRPLLTAPYIMVGDRFHDLEVATTHGFPSVGCAYGYGRPGELDQATCIVDSPDAIPDAIRSLLVESDARGADLR